MNLYLYDTLTAESLNLSTATATQPFIVSDNGFTPTTGTLQGGRETINLYATATMDVLETALQTLQAWLDIAESYYNAGDHRIYLYCNQVNATYTRRALVKGGQIRKTKWTQRCDTSTSTYYMEAQISLERECVELSEALALRNLVLNPSFEYDTDGDSTPDNWTAVGAAALVVTASAVAVHGRHVLNLRNNVAVAQANSDAITVVASTAYETCAYGAVIAGQVLTVTIYDITNAAEIDHYHITGVGATTFVRAQMEFTTPVGCVSIRVIVEGPQSTTNYFDCIYVGLRNTYGGSWWRDHDMWADYNVVNGHDDWEWDNANGTPYGAGADQNSTHHEIIDILGVAGDLPADIRVRAYQSAGLSFDWPRLSFMSLHEASRTFLSLQAESATAHSAPTLRTDGGASGPAANNCYELPVAAAADYFLYWTIYETDALRLAGKMVRIFAIIGNNPSIGATYTVQWGISPSTGAPAEYYTTPTLANNATVYWNVCPGPTFRFPQCIPWRPSGTDPASSFLYLWASQAAGYNCYIDRIILVPVEGYLECVDTVVSADASTELYAADDKYWMMEHAAPRAGEIAYGLPQSAGKMAVESVEPSDGQVRILFLPRHGGYITTPAFDTSTTLYIRWRYSEF